MKAYFNVEQVSKDISYLIRMDGQVFFMQILNHIYTDEKKF